MTIDKHTAGLPTFKSNAQTWSKLNYSEQHWRYSRMDDMESFSEYLGFNQPDSSQFFTQSDYCSIVNVNPAFDILNILPRSSKNLEFLDILQRS